MTRSPLFLAALASSAVPGLDPVSVEGVPPRPGDLFEIAYVQDSQDRRWVVKCPATPAAGAMLDDIAALSSLLGRRLDVAMPMVRGTAPVPEGRATVYLRLPGRPLDFAGLDAGHLAGEVGRTLAHIHNVEHLVFEEAGRPSYDAESHRRRQLSELDRAAATGHVPTALLTRWEHALEDVSLWRFAPTAVHGTFTGSNVLASFDDEDDTSTGRVRGVLAWEESRIGDPADDFAELARVAPPETLDAVLEAYARSRVERPDVHLVRRARLAAEMAPLRTLLQALASGSLELVERTADALRGLEARIEADDRRHAREDAKRSERTRAAREPAHAVLDRQHSEHPEQSEHSEHSEHPERLEPAWDATQPHTPFPMLGETQAISTSDRLAEGPAEPATRPATDPAAVRTDQPVDPAAGRPVERAVEQAVETPVAEAGAGAVDYSTSVRPAAGAREPDAAASPPPREGRSSRVASADAETPAPEAASAAPAPLVAPDAGVAPFEIDEVEALPDGVGDLHEGASDFVPVAQHEHRRRPRRA